jgi:hypothetical protein
MRQRGPRAGWALATSALAWASTAEAGETVTYTYDSLGRLVRVERSGTVNHGVDSRYSYDPADNRTNVTVGQSAAPPSAAAPSPSAAQPLSAPGASPLSGAQPVSKPPPWPLPPPEQPLPSAAPSLLPPGGVP